MHPELAGIANGGGEPLACHYNELAQLAGSLAHEIKNALSVIRMNRDLLAEDLAGAETPRERRARAKTDMVHDQCTRLENLLNDFLKFARVQSLDLLPDNLNEHVQSVLRMFDVQAHAAVFKLGAQRIRKTCHGKLGGSIANIPH